MWSWHPETSLSRHFGKITLPSSGMFSSTTKIRTQLHSWVRVYIKFSTKFLICNCCEYAQSFPVILNKIRSSQLRNGGNVRKTGSCLRPGDTKRCRAPYLWESCSFNFDIYSSLVRVVPKSWIFFKKSTVNIFLLTCLILRIMIPRLCVIR